MPVSANVAGQAYALMVMTPIVRGEEAALRSYLEGLRDRGASPLAKLRRTHFGRWVIVPDFVSDPKQPREDHLSGPFLLFTSCFDGALDSYLDELCEQLAPEAGEIWGRCAGCPEKAAGTALKGYLLHNQIDAGFFVAAYPKASVAKVKQSLELRERMIAFAVHGQALEPAELQQAFADEFTSL